MGMGGHQKRDLGTAFGGLQALCSVLGLHLPSVLRRGGPQGPLSLALGLPAVCRRWERTNTPQGVISGMNLKGMGSQPATHRCGLG